MKHIASITKVTQTNTSLVDAFIETTREALGVGTNLKDFF